MTHVSVAGHGRPAILRLALAACLAVTAAVLVFRAPPAVLEGDQPRYATLGLNLADHGVFSDASYAPGAQPAPSLAWAGPLVAVEIGFAAALDRGTHDALVCMASRTKGCDLRLPALRIVHLGEILVFLACLWWIAYLILGSELQAWLAAALGLGFREVFDFANLVMTEPLYLMAYSLFAAILVTAYVDRKGPAWWVATGLLLGAVVLVKTAALVLVVGLPVLLILEAALRKAPMSKALISALCVFVAAGVVVAAWMARSAILFDNLSMTAPAYLEATFSHRLAYNRMTWLEWLGGWLYYLPDFGDNAVRGLFGPTALQSLGFGPEGYYEYGARVLHPHVHALTAPNFATGYLFRTYVLGEPVKYTAVSALLLWRGIFVGRYLGLVGLLALAAALWLMPPRERAPLALLAILGFAIAAAHAALSICIPRYNLALIPVYAVSLAWALGWLWARLAVERRQPA
jgi:hypothetical protein